jgi:hypothetical protein
VRTILQNRTYIGAFVGHKYAKKSFKNKKILRVPEAEWIEVPGMFPAIIDEETFNLAQKVLQIKQRETKRKYENIYVGFLKCSDCGVGLSLKYRKGADGNPIHSFVCNRYRSAAETNGNNPCTIHYVTEKRIESALLASIRKFAEAAKAHEADYIAYAEKLVKSSDNTAMKQMETQLTRLKKRKTELYTIISRMYADYALGTITVELYQEMVSKYEQERTQVSERLDALNQSLADKESAKENTAAFLKTIRQYTEAETITRQMLVELIDKIVIHNGTGERSYRSQQIDIHYRINGLVDTEKTTGVR